MFKWFKRIVKVLAFTSIALVLLFIALAAWPLSYFSFPPPSYSTIILTNVSIVDIDNDTVLPARMVVIKNGLIDTIADNLFVYNTIGQDQVKQINADGQYLIPALWDMHVHLTKRSPYTAYPTFISYGITHVRDMRGAFNDTDPFAGAQTRLQQHDRAVESHQLVGPRIHGFTSFAIDGPHPMFKGNPSFFNCATPEDAIKLVHYLKGQGVTLIKVYNNIPREAFFALMKEANQLEMEVAGHKPHQISAIEASNAGMKSLEHALFFITESYSKADSIRQLPKKAMADNTALRVDMLKKQNAARLLQMFATFKKNNTWYCPTHLTRKQDAFAGDSSFRARYADINPILKFLSFEDLDATLQEDTSKLAAQAYKDVYFKGLQISGEAYRNGVKILCGSDVPELPGSSLHEELMELSAAGLPNFEVLRTAALYPAQYYGLEKQYGSVRVGKKADLILLEKNPILDIKNVKTINSVFVNGRHLDRRFLDELKQKVKSRDSSLVMSCKLLLDMLIYMVM